MNLWRSNLYAILFKLASKPTEELFSSSSPKNCRALLPLSTAVTANFDRFPIQNLMKKWTFKKNLKFWINGPTFERRNLEQLLYDLPVDEAIIDGQNVSFCGIRRRNIKAVNPPPWNENVPLHLSRRYLHQTVDYIFVITTPSKKRQKQNKISHTTPVGNLFYTL